MSVVLSVLTLAAATLVHEAGHFLAARALKIPVKEFSVGFGPALFKTQKKNGTVYALRPVLLGGYVVPERGAVEGSALWKQLLVYLAGPAANAACAVAVVAAAVAWALAGSVPALMLPVKAVLGGCMFLKLIAVHAAGCLHSGGLSVSGPVGMVAWLGEMAKSLSGPAALLPAALLNLALGLTNLLPLPALDGGRALMALFRVPPAWQERAAGACLGLLLLAAAAVTYADIMRLLHA
ncbi:MAG: site-2 protease family protein [Desulfotomaculales bacterium]